MSEGYRPDEKETGPSVSDHLQVLEDHKHGYETYTTRTLRRLLKESEARALAAEQRLAEVEAVLIDLEPFFSDAKFLLDYGQPTPIADSPLWYDRRSRWFEEFFRVRERIEKARAVLGSKPAEEVGR